MEQNFVCIDKVCLLLLELSLELIELESFTRIHLGSFLRILGALSYKGLSDLFEQVIVVF